MRRNCATPTSCSTARSAPQLILEQAPRARQARSSTLVEDDALLAENAGLTEWPVVLMGAFDEDFLTVPPEVLTTSMKAHQKCFSLRKTEASSPTDSSGRQSRSEGRRQGIVAGNERVIRARLADAKFFFDQDRKMQLETGVPKLKEIIFHDKLGTNMSACSGCGCWRARSRRWSAPIPMLAERAARLAKADLVTGMVGEFPELQGMMGRYYALDQQERPAVADAIARITSRSARPMPCRASHGVAVALADKLDTLVGFWAIDEKPTGSKDPYALRRAALGVIRMVLENEFDSR